MTGTACSISSILSWRLVAFAVTRRYLFPHFSVSSVDFSVAKTMAKAAPVNHCRIVGQGIREELRAIAVLRSELGHATSPAEIDRINREIEEHYTVLGTLYDEWIQWHCPGPPP